MPGPNRHRISAAPPLALALTAALGMVAADCLPMRTAWAQAPQPVAPQPVATQPGDARLSQPQLAQLLAPIALYPDALLTQMLMAATYPLEIVQAKHWLGRDNNAALKGDALVKALEAQPWDPSVKSLVPFPDVLAMMNDQLEWTQQLGDAVLAQQDDVFNTIQLLRQRAQEAGKLESGPQQTVNVTQNVTVAAPAPGAPPPVVAPPPQIITIEPTQPDTVFVPAYDPGVVFGTWPYAAYPPTYFPPPVGWGVGNALLTGMAFAGGAAVVGSLWGWARPGWGRGNIDVDVNRVNNINVNRNQISGNTWRHDVTHRQGVAYANADVRNRFQGDRPDRGQAAREEFRGRTGGAAGDRGPGGAFGDRGPGDRPGGGLGNRGPGDRPGAGLGDRGPGDRPGGGLGDRGPGGGLGGRGPGDRPGGGLGDRGPGPGAGLGDRGPGSRPSGGPGGGPGSNLADRTPGAATRPAARPGGDARPGPGAATRPAGQLPSGRPAAAPQPAARPSGGPQALQGMGQGRDISAAQQRGQASRQAPVSRPSPPAGVQRPQAGGGQFGGARAGAGGQGGGGARAAMGGQGGGGARAAAASHGGGRAAGGGGGRRGR